MIARHESNMKDVDIRNEITLLFLDQEKVYNKINYEYLKKALRQIEILENFIFWIRMLYKNVFVRLFINNHIEKRILILCEIKQRDSLNCILFVLMIKRLTRYIATNLTIKRIVMNDLWIKSLMYADDIMIIIRSQEKADAIMKIFELYYHVIEAKIN